MANYYTKLALVFWKSGNHMFHAATLHRLYVLTREQRKNLTTEELAKYVGKKYCLNYECVFDNFVFNLRGVTVSCLVQSHGLISCSLKKMHILINLSILLIAALKWLPFLVPVALSY